MTFLLAVPHRTQIAEGDCLAACATMVLEYLHIALDDKQISRLLRIMPYGAPLSNLRNLEEIGLIVIYEQGSPEILAAQLAAGHPCITPVRTSELSYWPEDTHHAVVVVGIDAKQIYVNDPAFAVAPIAIPRSEFELAWLEKMKCTRH